ncbi:MULTISPECIES: hypothetical protein [unclassified Mesorhizobium]|uniref:hypothetical protein n=1 Tax=unclassified Mesorhizobium TaxID=325217 RepID=UPI000BAF6773|nr:MULTISPECIES: hypothetical protein [unclassified Mesorhizobium]PBC22062.1 hypothetical protein CK226_15575 [Mesorhizobium sp. WSM4311]TRC89624.1 hypothetical protein FJV82_34025 [Mesorhizobium sp. WSM4305]
MPDSVLRVSILRCDAAKFAAFREMMVDDEAELRPGIEALPGLLVFYAGADEATSSLINTSVWDTLEHARQLDTFQPMLDAGKRFVAAGARLERPIMHYTSLWRFGPLA